MSSDQFRLNENTIPVIQEIGQHMPGGFFIYKAAEPHELIFANSAVLDIFGCRDQEEKVREQQGKMITALASDYRSVYHVNLDTDEATCYRGDPTDTDQHPEGVTFPYHERFVYYAEKYVTDEYRDGFLEFIEPEKIRERLSKELIIVYRYLVNRGGREYYEMIRMAGVRHAEDRDDHIVHAVGLGLTVIDEEIRKSDGAQQRAQRGACGGGGGE